MAVPLTVELFNRGPLDNNIYLLKDEAASEFVVIDPSMDSAPVLEHTRNLVNSGWTLNAIWNTHGHFDHVFDNHLWKKSFDVPLLMHEADLFFIERLREQALWFGLTPPEKILPDGFFHAGQTLLVGEHEVQVIHTPGHSPGSVSFYVPSGSICVSGDVLFVGSAGRFDLPGASAIDLETSVRRLLQLPDETQLLPGHGRITNVAREKASNPAFLHPQRFFQRL